MPLRFGSSSIGPVLALFACILAPAQTAKISFSNDVAPILAKNCAQCHAATPAMGNLDLRTRDSALKGGQHGPAIVPGNAATSRLYQHLTGQEQPEMPMGGRLSDAEIAVIKAWIDGGAEWDATAPVNASKPATTTEHKFTDQQRNYWAFQKVTKPPVPAVSAHNPIDAFVQAKLQAQHLKPNPPADKITLLRRAYLDLTGLPPSP
jgi:hypothetical protein